MMARSCDRFEGDGHGWNGGSRRTAPPSPPPPPPSSEASSSTIRDSVELVRTRESRHANAESAQTSERARIEAERQRCRPYINRFIYLSTRVVDGGLCRGWRDEANDELEKMLEEEKGRRNPLDTRWSLSPLSPHLSLSLALFQETKSNESKQHGEQRQASKIATLVARPPRIPGFYPALANPPSVVRHRPLLCHRS